MLQIEQVRLLEERVRKVIQRLEELKRENTALRAEVLQLRSTGEALQERITGYDAAQAEIESGILSALQRLDEVEDAVAEGHGEDRRVALQETPEETSSDAPEEEPPHQETDGPVEELDSRGAPEDRHTEDPEAGESPNEEAGPELDIF